jgi:hypothetical protein
VCPDPSPRRSFTELLPRQRRDGTAVMPGHVRTVYLALSYTYTTGRPHEAALRLAAADAVAISVTVSLAAAATAAAVSVWVLDRAWRAGWLGTVRAVRPTEE